MSTDLISSFWQRFGLSEEDRSDCLQVVQERYVGCQVEESRDQGYCSITFLVSPSHSTAKASSKHDNSALSSHDGDGGEESLIVQIRPMQHALDMGIVQAAKEIYSSLAPNTQVLNLSLPQQLHIYEMQRMHGMPLLQLLPRTQKITSALRMKQERFVGSFAALIAHSWSSSSKALWRSRITRADSPMEVEPKIMLDCTGKVGSSIVHRLEKLSDELPDPHLREVAKTTLAGINAMDPMPVVLNHGDLIPSNILVDKYTWEITGLIDWAEAEYLPLGTCLYGLEHVLGYISTVSPSAMQTIENTSDFLGVPKFIYHDHASYLRDLFWTQLCELVPDVKTRLEDVKTIRDLGVLLWYGYAWDDGAIDRVVNEVDDAVEVACLRGFLDIT